MSILSETLDAFASAFEKHRRPDGVEFYRVAGGAPEWIGTDAVMAIHQALDDRLPDDWVYETAYRCALRLGEYCEPDDTREDLDDHACEIADGLDDVYNCELTRWLASHLYNVALCDEAIDDLGEPGDGVINIIARGQYLAISRICAAVLDLCDAAAEGGDE